MGRCDHCVYTENIAYMRKQDFFIGQLHWSWFGFSIHKKWHHAVITEPLLFIYVHMLHVNTRQKTHVAFKENIPGDFFVFCIINKCNKYLFEQTNPTSVCRYACTHSKSHRATFYHNNYVVYFLYSLWCIGIEIYNQVIYTGMYTSIHQLIRH